MHFHPPTPGRLLSTLSAAGMGMGTWFVDVFNETHVFNPRWTPHAKFHGAQGVSMCVALSLMSLYLLWRRHPSASAREQKQALWDAMLVLDLNWFTQFAAWWFPGTLLMDPEFGETNAQLYLQAGLVTLHALAYVLDAGRVREPEGKEGKVKSA